MMRFTLLIILAIMPLQIVFSQLVRDAYNLDMKIPGENVRWSWLIHANKTSFSLDSSKIVKGKYALKILSRRRIGDSHDASFKLMRTILLPERANNEVGTVTIRCKNKNMKNLKFSVIGIDEHETPQFSDSVFIGKSSWKKYSISFRSENVKAIRVCLSLQENHLLDMQTAWVDRIFISIGGKTINDINVEDLYPKTFSELNKDSIIPLSFQADDNVSRIFDINACPKIVGLGESTHGSQTVKEANYQFMRLLISKLGYRIILTERCIDLSLMCDLYIRGLLPESYGDQIKEDSKGYFDDYLSFFDFLTWARKYNETAETKVRIFGCSDYLDKQTGLFEYFQKILDKTNPNLSFYFKEIVENQFDKVRDLVKNDTRLKSGMDSADYNYLMFLLEMNDPNLELKSRDQLFKKDELMWAMARKIIEIYAPKDEKVIVEAHSDHISKYTSLLSADENRPALGHFLADRFPNDYFAISFQLGEGSYTEDDGNLFGKTVTQMLQTAPKSSFEYRGLQTGIDYFYCSTKQLPQDISHLRMLLRTGMYLDQFYFCSIKKYFDGLVFIRKTQELNNIENYPAFYIGGLIQHKQRKMREELGKLGIKVASENGFW